jgi:hypothetical protein
MTIEGDEPIFRNPEQSGIAMVDIGMVAIAKF